MKSLFHRGLQEFNRARVGLQVVPASVSVAMPLLGDVSHLGHRVSRARRHTWYESPVQPFKICAVQCDVEGVDVLINITWPLCSWYGNNVVTLGKYPGARHLGWSAPFGRGELIEGLE